MFGISDAAQGGFKSGAAMAPDRWFDLLASQAQIAVTVT